MAGTGLARRSIRYSHDCQYLGHVGYLHAHNQWSFLGPHSWDGCVNRSSIRTAHHNGVTEVGSVHDSLSTPASHCGIMAASIREAAIEIFSDDPLERFRQGQQAMLPQGIHLPEPPQRGDLDINVLRDAPYFFS